MTYKKAIKPVVKLFFVILIIYAVAYGAIFSLRIALAVDSPLVVVSGVSMNPTYYDGDLLVIQGVVNKSKILLGDIIVFHNPRDLNMLIVHRVIDRFVKDNQLYFQTKGDNVKTNPIPDQFIVSEEDIVGVVLWKLPIPALGSILLFTQSPIGRFLLIICIVFYYCRHVL